VLQPSRARLLPNKQWLLVKRRLEETNHVHVAVAKNIRSAADGTYNETISNTSL